MPTGFDAATTKVEPDRSDVANAAIAHTAVRDVLEQDDTLTAWGIDSVLIGSYKRHVSIRRIKDVDVFCRLPDIPAGIDGEGALGEVQRVLVADYGADAVHRQARSGVHCPPPHLPNVLLPSRCRDDAAGAAITAHPQMLALVGRLMNLTETAATNRHHAYRPRQLRRTTTP